MSFFTLPNIGNSVDGSEIWRENQLRLVVSPIIYRVVWDFFHQHFVDVFSLFPTAAMFFVSWKSNHSRRSFLQLPHLGISQGMPRGP